MILVDASVWVLTLRDKTSGVVVAFRKRVGSELTILSRFNQLELLQCDQDLQRIAKVRELDEEYFSWH